METPYFAQRAANYVNSKPGRKADLREILRHLSNKRKADIERISGILQGNYQLHLRKEGRSRFFIYIRPLLENVKAVNMRITEAILEEERELFSETID